MTQDNPADYGITDKYDAVADVMERHDYDIDDLAKLMCRVFGRSVRELGNDKSHIRKVIYGEGSKFILRLNMLPQETHEIAAAKVKGGE